MTSDVSTEPVGVMTGVPIGRGVHADPVVPKPGGRVLVIPLESARFDDYGSLLFRTRVIAVVESGKHPGSHSRRPQVNTYAPSRFRIEVA